MNTASPHTAIFHASRRRRMPGIGSGFQTCNAINSASSRARSLVMRIFVPVRPGWANIYQHNVT